MPVGKTFGGNYNVGERIGINRRLDGQDWDSLQVLNIVGRVIAVDQINGYGLVYTLMDRLRQVVLKI